jgi:hypothetical protein
MGVSRHIAARPAAPAASRDTGAGGTGRGRLRPAPTPPLRHDPDDAEIRRRADALEDWLREHPGVQIVCRDGSRAHAQAVRPALSDAVQVADRWHIFHKPAEAVLKEAAAHSACWATAGRRFTKGGAQPPPANGGSRSTICSARGSDCSNVHASSTLP